jgi:hypothetical protein
MPRTQYSLPVATVRLPAVTLLLLAVAMVCSCSATAAKTAAARRPEQAARAAPGPLRIGLLPLPSGPVIRVDDDHPYDVQGVAATTVSMWKGETAPAGYHFVLVTIAVVSPTDGPPLAAGFTDYDLGVLYPGCGSSCFNSLERSVPYATRDQLRSRAIDTGFADSGQLLEPGNSYYATLHQQIPWNVDLSALKLCRSGLPDGVCTMLGQLPTLKT